MSSQHKVVIVTGASRGIGAATALLLASQGYAVVVNYRQQRAAAETVVQAIITAGGRAIAVAADVSQEAEVARLFDFAEQQLGAVTHLVNNAGRLQPQSQLAQISLARFQQMLTDNLQSCFLCCREAARRFSEGTAIVNVSSVAARTGSAGEYVDYAAAKAGIDTLSKGLALELAGRGIRVNVVRPGFIDTEMHADGGEPGRVERLKHQIPLQRAGTAAEVAAAIAFLLSAEAAFSTGIVLDVAGGR